MADVIRLTDWLARTPRRETVRLEAPAEILLFTGVRYERLRPVVPAARGGKAKKRGVSDTARRT